MKSISFDPGKGCTYTEAAKLLAFLVFEYNGRLETMKHLDVFYIDFSEPPPPCVLDFIRDECPNATPQY